MQTLKKLHLRGLNVRCRNPAWGILPCLRHASSTLRSHFPILPCEHLASREASSAALYIIP